MTHYGIPEGGQLLLSAGPSNSGSKTSLFCKNKLDACTKPTYHITWPVNSVFKVRPVSLITLVERIFHLPF